MKTINTKIKSVKVQKEVMEVPVQAPESPKATMNEKMERPERLTGTTYKIKPAVIEESLYITINDITLNEGTEYEEVRPFEIFINSKNIQQFQWITALTRVMSAVFRKGGDYQFLIEELKSVFDPHGGYFVPQQGFKPSIVAHIGAVIEHHCTGKSMLKVEKESPQSDSPSSPEVAKPTKNMAFCPKCNEQAMVFQEGCETCLSCGYSKCS